MEINQPAPVNLSPENHWEHSSVLSTGMASLRSGCGWGDRGATGIPPAQGSCQQHQRRMSSSQSHPFPARQYGQISLSTGVPCAMAAGRQAETLGAAFPSKKGLDGHLTSPLQSLLLFMFLTRPAQALHFGMSVEMNRRPKQHLEMMEEREVNSVAQIKPWAGGNSCPGRKKRPLHLHHPGMD